MASSENVAPSPLEIEIRRIVRAELAAMKSEGDPLVAHTDWPGVSRRQAAALARRGEIAGATKRGKTWFARRSAVEAYVSSGAQPPANDTDDEIDSIISRARRAR